MYEKPSLCITTVFDGLCRWGVFQRDEVLFGVLSNEISPVGKQGSYYGGLAMVSLHVSEIAYEVNENERRGVETIDLGVLNRTSVSRMAWGLAGSKYVLYTNLSSEMLRGLIQEFYSFQSLFSYLYEGRGSSIGTPLTPISHAAFSILASTASSSIVVLRKSSRRNSASMNNPSSL